MKEIARWISILAHPFVMVALLVTVPAARQSAGSPNRSVLLVVVAVIVPVVVLMVRQVRRGRWSNVDASKPSERPVLFAVSLAGILGALAWLLLNDPRSFLVRGLVVIAGFLLVVALVTRWIKVSLHVAFGALTATSLCLLGSLVGYALIPIVAALFWSRIVLARHSIAEVLAGLLVGALTGLVLVRF